MSATVNGRRRRSWSLDALFASADDARAHAESALAEANAFAERWSGRLADLDGATLAEALAELADLRAARQEAKYYHYLAESTDSENAEIRDLGAWLEPRLTELANVIRGVELEWIGLPADTADRLLGSPEVAGEAHALSKLRRSVPYTLSEPEERLLNERDATALKAWQTLFNRHVSTLATDFDSGSGSEPHTVSQLTSFLGYPDRDLRGRATRPCASWSCRSSSCWRSATTRSSRTDCSSTGSGAIRSRCCRRISRTSWRQMRCSRCSMRSRPPTRSRSAGCG